MQHFHHSYHFVTFLQYSCANSREEKENLFLVLLDYVLDQINNTSLMTGDSTYSFDEIQPLVTMLTLAGVPEAIFIALKHGVQGIGEILRRSVSIALPRSSNFECLNSVRLLHFQIQFKL